MLLALIVKFFVTAALVNQFPPGPEIASLMIGIVIQTITVIVVAVPEGFADGCHHGARVCYDTDAERYNLVRVMAACEHHGQCYRHLL